MGGVSFQVITSYLPKVANFNVSHLHAAPPLDVTPFEFCRNLRHPKRVPGLSCGVVCVILRLAVSAEHRLVTDRHTTTAYTVLAWRRAVKKINRFCMRIIIKRGASIYIINGANNSPEWTKTEIDSDRSLTAVCWHLWCLARGPDGTHGR